LPEYLCDPELDTTRSLLRCGVFVPSAIGGY